MPGALSKALSRSVADLAGIYSDAVGVFLTGGRTMQQQESESGFWDGSNANTPLSHAQDQSDTVTFGFRRQI